MKFLFDLLPVVLFFVAFKLADIYVATAVAIATSVLQVAWLTLRRRRVPIMLWASLAIIAVFGGATLLLQDETFIKWKPTVLYWLDDKSDGFEKTWTFLDRRIADVMRVPQVLSTLGKRFAGLPIPLRFFAPR